VTGDPPTDAPLGPTPSSILPGRPPQLRKREGRGQMKQTEEERRKSKSTEKGKGNGGERGEEEELILMPLD